MRDDSLVERLHALVADGQPVEWDAVPADALAPESLAILKALELMLRPPEPPQDPPRGLATPSPDGWWGARFRLEAELGRGSYGVVYRAFDERLQVPVAVKLLHPHLALDAEDRLLHEARLLAKVRHPNVVRVQDVQEHEGRPGLIMELLHGRPLDDELRARGRMSEGEAVVIATDVCRALSAVHAQGLVHRDVKPRNIIREDGGRIVLMDFGAGLRVEEAMTADPTGTPLYMAPEVLLGTAPATVASDVYSVGVLLFNLLTGHLPYDAASLEELRAQVRNGSRRRLLSERADLPTPFVQVVERALAADPQRRWPTPAALVDALLATRTGGQTPRALTMFTRVAIGAAVSVAVLTVAGGISATAFNLTIGRQGYASESLFDWFVLGRRSLVLPVVVALLAAAAIGLLAAVRRIVTSASEAARRLDARLLAFGYSLATRCGMDHPEVGTCWLMLATACATAAAGVYWAPLLWAATSDISTAPVETLRVLAPDRLEYQTNFRLVLSLVASAHVAASFGLVRLARARAARVPPWLLVTNVAFVVLLYGSMQLPYRLLNDNDEFKVVTWQGQRCHLLGATDDDVLLFCPTMPTPRRRLIHKADARIENVSEGESLFASFAAEASAPTSTVPGAPAAR